LGVSLVPGENLIEARAVRGDTATGDTLSVVWDTLYLNDLPYGIEDMVVRPGDTLLVDLRGRVVGDSIALECMEPEVQQIGVWPCTQGSPVYVRIPYAGKFKIQGYRNGVVMSTFDVRAPMVDLRAPIADEIDFQREKKIEVRYADDGDIVYVPNEDRLLEVWAGQADGAERRLMLRARGPGRPVLSARIGMSNGPMIAQCPVDAFEQRTNAESTIRIIDTLPDGSLVTEAILTMRPLVPHLQVRLSMYTGGGTFEDGTTSMVVSSDDYTRKSDGSGTLLYRIIRSPRAGSGLCHTTQTFQDAVLVGKH
jgi:hypothetical protein